MPRPILDLWFLARPSRAAGASSPDARQAGVSVRHRRSCYRTDRGVGEAVHDPQNDLLSGVGDGAALEEAQLLLYPSGGSQERIERGSQSPRATSKSAANGLPMPYAAHCESARCGHTC